MKSRLLLSIVASALLTAGSSPGITALHAETPVITPSAVAGVPLCTECGFDVQPNGTGAYTLVLYYGWDYCAGGAWCIRCEDVEECEARWSHTYEDVSEEQLNATSFSECHQCGAADGEANPLEIAAHLLASGDTEGLRDLIRASDGRVFINESRAALQGYECAERIGLSIQLSTVAFAALREGRAGGMVVRFLSRQGAGNATAIRASARTMRLRIPG